MINESENKSRAKTKQNTCSLEASPENQDGVHLTPVRPFQILS